LLGVDRGVIEGEGERAGAFGESGGLERVDGGVRFAQIGRDRPAAGLEPQGLPGERELGAALLDEQDLLLGVAVRREA